MILSNHIISQFTQPFFFFILTNPFTAPTTSFHSLLSPFSSSFLRTPSLPQPHHFTVYSALFLLHSYEPLHCPNHIISQFTQPFFFFILTNPFTAPTTSFHSLLSPFSSSFLWTPSLPQPHHFTVYSALFLLHSYGPLHCPNHIISVYSALFLLHSYGPLHCPSL